MLRSLFNLFPYVPTSIVPSGAAAIAIVGALKSRSRSVYSLRCGGDHGRARSVISFSFIEFLPLYGRTVINLIHKP